jgi:hypothetical protein
LNHTNFSFETAVNWEEFSLVSNSSHIIVDVNCDKREINSMDVLGSQKRRTGYPSLSQNRTDEIGKLKKMVNFEEMTLNSDGCNFHDEQGRQDTSEEMQDTNSEESSCASVPSSDTSDSSRIVPVYVSSEDGFEIDLKSNMKERSRALKRRCKGNALGIENRTRDCLYLIPANESVITEIASNADESEHSCTIDESLFPVSCNYNDSTTRNDRKPAAEIFEKFHTKVPQEAFDVSFITASTIEETIPSLTKSSEKSSMREKNESNVSLSQSFLNLDSSSYEGSEENHGVDLNDSSSCLILGTSHDDETAQLNILSRSLMEGLLCFTPKNLSTENFWLKFSLVRDGAKFNSLRHLSRFSPNTIMAIQTTKGDIFGRCVLKMDKIIFFRDVLRLYQSYSPKCVEVLLRRHGNCKMNILVQILLLYGRCVINLLIHLLPSTKRKDLTVNSMHFLFQLPMFESNYVDMMLWVLE